MMKNNIKYWMGLPVLLLFSCNDYMDLENYQNIPTEEAYNTVQDVQNGLNGAYYAFGHNYFYGRNIVALGDMAADNAVASSSTGHFLSINRYNFSDTDGDLDALWVGGYRVMDRTTRTIQGVRKVLAEAETQHLTETDIASLHSYMSQSFALRALTAHALVNIFGLPYENGGPNGQLGIALLTDAPLLPFQKTSRSTVGETYGQILSDIADAKATYAVVDNYNLDNEDDQILLDQYYMNKAAIYAVEARVALFMKQYDKAINAADSAIILRASGDVSNEQYLKMWSSTAISDEDIFTIVKSEDDNLSANSLNTLYGSYRASVTDTLVGIFDSTDIRLKLINTGNLHPKKFDGIPTSQAVNNIPVFRKSEMYLILAEAYAEKGDLVNAKTKLFFTAQRNKNIASNLQPLPSDQAGLLNFIAQERRREFFEEGFRWYDARRTGEAVAVSDGNYPDFDVAAFVYPIPASEINAGFGIIQNAGWENQLPK